MSFDNLFDKSDLPRVLGVAKTLSKEEVRVLHRYIEKNAPKTIVEFGTQWGCSTRAFLEISKWLNHDLDLHSWDVHDQVRNDYISKQDFTLHLEDMTGREGEIFDTYNPDFIFLDAHAYQMTRAIMVECLKGKINFAAHDTYLPALEEVRRLTNDFTNRSMYVNWEVFLIGDLISKDLWEVDNYEDEFVKVESTRLDGGYGMTMVEVKKPNPNAGVDNG